MNQEVIIVYKSIYHGNTKKILEAMQQELKCKMVTTKQAASIELEKYKVVILGSGIYFTSHHPEVMNIAGRLKSSQQVIIVSTRGCPFLGKYHQAIKEVLQERKVSVLGEFSCRGYDCTGPYNLSNGGNKGKPNEGDAMRAKKLVHKLLPQMCTKNEVPVGKHVWINKDVCINCKACFQNCPMHIFTVEDGMVKVKDDENCTHCNLCREKCPQGCVSVYHTKMELIQIAKKHGWRKSLPTA